MNNQWQVVNNNIPSLIKKYYIRFGDYIFNKSKKFCCEIPGC